MIRSIVIVTVAALGFALAGCAPATTIEAPAPAPAVAPAPVPAIEQPIEQAPAVEQQQPDTEQAPVTEQSSQQTDQQPAQQTESSPSSSTSVDCQGGPDGATYCEGGSAEQNRQAEQQGDADYAEFCQQQATKPQMCQTLGY